MSAPIGHVMILASAGSGKTYALTNRFIKLLALGAAPERIVALTFTRKAAGEFFDEILNKLARAASEPPYARQLANEIGWRKTPSARTDGAASVRTADGIGPADFLSLLRAVADAMHRLRLGTIDGFFARIARNFPLELGLAGEFELLEEHAARMERSRVLRRLFDRRSGAAGGLGDAQREFVEAFKRATFGAEEKRLGAQLDAFLDAHQEVYLGVPDRDLWGNVRRIWADGCRWFAAPGDVPAALAALRGWLAGTAVGEKQRQRWEEFFEAFASWAPGVVPTRQLAYALEKALARWSDLEAGRAVLEFDRKKQELDATACAALASLVRHFVGGELSRRLEMTAGIHAVLAGYEAMYHAAVRRAGKLTFADIQRLLLPEAGAPRLSADATDQRRQTEPRGRGERNQSLDTEAVSMAATDADERRLLIDYRLDGEIDHWLLDEFQDTRFGQWSLLRNLIDEAVQDPTGARSFFYVGDVKQAIFAWREGDPRLFREIFDHYNAIRPGTIDEEHLVRSWRSGPAIVGTVNRIFGDAPALAQLFPGEAARAWNREWRMHETARSRLTGHAALLHAGGAKDSAAASEAARFDVTLALLQEIEPLARGLSCAVLVQKNATAAALADFLRRTGGIPAVAESDLHVCTDNPVGAALLALVKAAAHPGDTLAWEHVQMSPLGRVLAEAGLVAPEQVTERLLQEIHRDGFECTLGRWARRLEPSLATDDAFSRERIAQFAAAAGWFDATGSRDVAEFIAFMQRHTVRDAESASVVRVMTIHKSKGLGFDLVILPDLEGQKLDCRRDGLAVQRAPNRTVEWVLDLPGKLLHDYDTVLSKHVRAAEADACYEALSLLYVAMTRAKRAMYLVTKPPGVSQSRNYPRLLAATLGEEAKPVRVGAREFAGTYVDGDPQWHREVPLVPADKRERDQAAPSGIEPLACELPLRTQRLVARRPSSVPAGNWAGAQLFSLVRSDRTEFGTAVHRLLAEVEWETRAGARQRAAEWRARGEEPAVVAEALGCLEAPELAAVWTRRPQLEVWRERAFEIVLDGAWISGVFDRVVVERDTAGQPLRANVFDFKTDRSGVPSDSGELARRHARQLNLYRRVASVLTGVPLARVTGEAIFTALRRAVPVAAEEGVDAV